MIKAYLAQLPLRAGKNTAFWRHYGWQHDQLPEMGLINRKLAEDTCPQRIQIQVVKVSEAGLICFGRRYILVAGVPIFLSSWPNYDDGVFVFRAKRPEYKSPDFPHTPWRDDGLTWRVRHTLGSDIAPHFLGYISPAP